MPCRLLQTAPELDDIPLGHCSVGIFTSKRTCQEGHRERDPVVRLLRPRSWRRSPKLHSARTLAQVREVPADIPVGRRHLDEAGEGRR